MVKKTKINYLLMIAKILQKFRKIMFLSCNDKKYTYTFTLFDKETQKKFKFEIDKLYLTLDSNPKIAGDVKEIAHIVVGELESLKCS